VISGNGIGVSITGIKQDNGQIVGSGNVIAGNLIGTDSSGTLPVSNLDIGVFIDDAEGNVVGPGNDIAANGIAGVEIFNQGSTGNLVSGNTIGEGTGGQMFTKGGRSTISSNGPEPGISVYTDAQLNGVVILGASDNTIGTSKNVPGIRPNIISGNLQVGVYVTKSDYNGLAYSVPVSNAVSGNTIRSDGLYGVLLYNAPNNLVPPFNSGSRKLVQNRYGREKTSFRNYVSSFDSGTSLPTKSSKTAHAKTVKHDVRLVKARPSVRRQMPAVSAAKAGHDIGKAHHRAGK
jgi:hypothetical protein